MGLTLRPYCNVATTEASRSYSGFNAYRHELAKAIGIDLDQMEGFGGELIWDHVSSPLKALLNHSDCDGIIHWFECRDMLPDLEAVTERLPAQEQDNHKELIATVKECIELETPLLFC